MSERMVTMYDPVEASASAKLSMTFAKAMDKLTLYSRIREGWNAYGVQRINHKSIALAASFLAETESRGWVLPDLAPTSRGGVQFQWFEPYMKVEARPGSLYLEYLFIDGEQEASGRVFWPEAQYESVVFTRDIDEALKRKENT